MSSESKSLLLGSSAIVRVLVGIVILRDGDTLILAVMSSAKAEPEVITTDNSKTRSKVSALYIYIYIYIYRMSEN